MGLALTLATGKIDQIHLADLESGIARRGLLRGLNIDREDRMTSGRVLVHGRLTHFTILLAGVQQTLQIWHRLADDLSKVLNIDAPVRVFLDLKRLISLSCGALLLIGSLVVGSELAEEVEDRLVVNFEVGAADQEILSTVLRAIDESEDMVYRLRNDTFQVAPLGVEGRRMTHHSVTLTAAGLTVREDRS